LTVAGAFTPRQFATALDDLERALDPEPASPAAWAARLPQLLRKAETLADLAQALAQDCGGDPGAAETAQWAGLLRACVESHARDLEATFSWTRSFPVGESAAAGFLASAAGALLDALPDLLESAAEWARAPGGRSELAQALREAARAAAVRARRLASIAGRAAKLVDETEFTFLYDPERKLFSIGFKVADG